MFTALNELNHTLRVNPCIVYANCISGWSGMKHNVEEEFTLVLYGAAFRICSGLNRAPIFDSVGLVSNSTQTGQT